MPKQYYTSSEAPGQFALRHSDATSHPVTVSQSQAWDPQLGCPIQQTLSRHGIRTLPVPNMQQVRPLESIFDTHKQIGSTQLKTYPECPQPVTNTQSSYTGNVSYGALDRANSSGAVPFSPSSFAHSEYLHRNNHTGNRQGSFHSVSSSTGSFSEPSSRPVSENNQFNGPQTFPLAPHDPSEMYSIERPKIVSGYHSSPDFSMMQGVQHHSDSFYATREDQAPLHPYSAPSSGTALVKNNSVPTTFSGHCEAQAGAEAAFQSLIPIMDTIDAWDYDTIMSRFSGYCEDSEPLDKIYDVLFNSEHTARKYESTNRFHTFDICQPSNFESQGLKLIFLILSFLKSPKDTICHANGITLDNLAKPAMDPQDFARSLLAFRIMKLMITEVKRAQMHETRLSNDSINIAYTLFCQKLLLRQPSSVSLKARVKRLVLNHLQVQHVSKSAFPDSHQRIWRRKGDSQTYYKGYKWNDDVLDKKMRSMIAQGQTDILDQENSVPSIPSLSTNTVFESTSGLQPDVLPLIPKFESTIGELAIAMLNSPITPPTIPPITPPCFIKNDMSTFVGRSMRFPKKDSTLRDWSREQGKTPRHSRWTSALMTKSLNAINKYGIRYNVLVQNFKVGDFSDVGARSLPVAVADAIARLKRVSAPADVYLQLYRAVILLVLPAVLASDLEISSQARTRLSNCLKKMLSILECKPLFDSGEMALKLRVFIDTIRSMVHLVELKSHTVQIASFEPIVQILKHDIDVLEIADDGGSTHAGVSDDEFATSFCTMTQKYGFRLPTLSEDTQDEEMSQVLRRAARIFTGHMKSLQEGFVEILHDFREQYPKAPVQYLAYETFVKQTQIIHREILQDPFIAQLPISVFKFTMSQMMVQVQNLSFHQFGNAGPELSRLCFETWYVSSALMHEYVRVLCEVIALSDILP